MVRRYLQTAGEKMTLEITISVIVLCLIIGRLMYVKGYKDRYKEELIMNNHTEY